MALGVSRIGFDASFFNNDAETLQIVAPFLLISSRHVGTPDCEGPRRKELKRKARSCPMSGAVRSKSISQSSHKSKAPDDEFIHSCSSQIFQQRCIFFFFFFFKRLIRAAALDPFQAFIWRKGMLPV